VKIFAPPPEEGRRGLRPFEEPRKNNSENRFRVTTLNQDSTHRHTYPRTHIHGALPAAGHESCAPSLRHSCPQNKTAGSRFPDCRRIFLNPCALQDGARIPHPAPALPLGSVATLRRVLHRAAGAPPTSRRSTSRGCCRRLSQQRFQCRSPERQT